MPKLTQQTLEKRFPCLHCGETFRTRQGLSGHIQFKHPTGTGGETKSPAEWIVDIAGYKSALQLGGFSNEDVSELTQIRAGWALFEQFMGVAPGNKKTKLGAADFKTYLIVAYAQMRANRRLIHRLNKDLNEAIGKLIELQSKTDAGTYKKYL
jgi:hypothetical protein